MKAPADPMLPLARTPLHVDDAAIDEAMRPFLVSEGAERQWRSALNRRWRRAALRSLGRLTGGLLSRGGRNRSTIESEYQQAWSVGYRRYALGRNDLKGAPWIWRGRKLMLDPAAATRIRTLLFAAAIEELRPRRVLEVGSGNGINLLSLAGAFPEVEFTGLELTQEGVEQARRAQSDSATLNIIEDYSPLDIADCSAIGRISFRQGDAGAIPFDESSFDLVMTVLAVEQMESIRQRALGEIARVCRGHVLMLEPFRDSNATPFKRLYIHSRDYFRGSVGELGDFGLRTLWATEDFPQEAFLGAALVLAEKV